MKMTFHRSTPEKIIAGVVQTAPAAGEMTVNVGTWSMETWPKPPPLVVPDDGREYVKCAENLWWIITECLAYPAGQPFPLDERPLLITESALRVLHRAGKRACDAEPSA